MLFHFLFLLVSAAVGDAKGKARPLDKSAPPPLYEGEWGGNLSNFFLEQVASSLSSHSVSPSPSLGSLLLSLGARTLVTADAKMAVCTRALRLVLAPTSLGSLCNSLSPSREAQR